MQYCTVVVGCAVVVVRATLSEIVDFVDVVEGARLVVGDGFTKDVVVLSGENRVVVVVEIPVATAEVGGVEGLVVDETEAAGRVELVVEPEIVVVVLLVAPTGGNAKVVVDCEPVPEGDVVVGPGPMVVVALATTIEDAVVVTLDGQAS